jgi:hypothetical protein
MNSRTTRQFRELFARLPSHVQQQAMEITELADDYRKLDFKPISVPKE